MSLSAPSRRTGLLAAIVVALAAVVPALLALSGGFLFDDLRFIVNNPNVQETPSVLRIFTDGTTVDPVSPAGIVRPMRTLDFVLDRALFGQETLGFHLHSVLWHALTAVLLMALLRRLFSDLRVAFVASLVFAVHPAHVEAVSWITSRGDVAMGACVLASVLFAMRESLAMSLVFAALATLYKETAVALPIAILAMRWLKLVRVAVWPYAVVSVAYLVYRMVALPNASHGVDFVLGGSTAGTFATMIRGFGFYVASAVFPTQSTDWYLMPSTSFADAAVVLWLAVHAAILWSAWRARASTPLWTLAVAWFYAFLLPVANWPVFLQLPTADRFLYLPLAGAAVALALALRRAPRGATIPALAAAAAIGVASASMSGAWRDEDTLWRTLTASHDSPRGHEYLGNETRKAALEVRARAFKLNDGPEKEALGRETTRLLELALWHLHKTLEVWYGFEGSDRSQGGVARKAEVNAANAAFILGRDGEALLHADAAIAVHGPPTPEPFYTRGLALLNLGYAPQAMTAMWRARELGFGGPDQEIAEFFLRAAIDSEGKGMPDAADAAYTTAIEAAPTNAGVLRDAATKRRAELRARPRAGDSARREKAEIDALDRGLARLPPACPAPRGPK